MVPKRVNGRACRILLVEDNPDAARSLRFLLEMAGHLVETAPDGREGMETARRFGPEVVLCDIGLPGMDGYDVARALRREPRLADAYLVALTGYDEAEDRRRALDAGFDDHLTKPIAFTDLQKVLENRKL
jgi:CheY-like chemotaxis protein